MERSIYMEEGDHEKNDTLTLLWLQIRAKSDWRVFQGYPGHTLWFPASSGVLVVGSKENIEVLAWENDFIMMDATDKNDKFTLFQQYFWAMG